MKALYGLKVIGHIAATTMYITAATGPEPVPTAPGLKVAGITTIGVTPGAKAIGNNQLAVFSVQFALGNS